MLIHIQRPLSTSGHTKRICPQQELDQLQNHILTVKVGGWLMKSQAVDIHHRTYNRTYSSITHFIARCLCTTASFHQTGGLLCVLFMSYLYMGSVLLPKVYLGLCNLGLIQQLLTAMRNISLYHHWQLEQQEQLLGILKKGLFVHHFSVSK